MQLTDEMFELGRQKGAIEFCSHLYGKIPAPILNEEWQSFCAKNLAPKPFIPQPLRVPTNPSTRPEVFEEQVA